MQFLDNFDQLWKAFIRPPRQQYQLSDLGPKRILSNQYVVKRHDINLQNNRNQMIVCSLFEPIDVSQKFYEESQSPYPCIIYGHCNSGSRIEALSHLENVISEGIGYFCFDFSGSGNSEGDYVTLGKNEADDLAVVVKYLRNSGKISHIGLWGRSMGAVTCLLYAANDDQISGIAADSPFINLRSLAMDIASQRVNLPTFIIDQIFNIVKSKIQNATNLDIDTIDLTKKVKSIFSSAVFVTSREDQFVKCEQTEKIYSLYSGQKKIIYLTGQHNAPRSKQFSREIVKFFKEQFKTVKVNHSISRFYNSFATSTKTKTQRNEINQNSQNLIQRRQQSGHQINQNRINSSINNTCSLIVQQTNPDNIITEENIPSSEMITECDEKTQEAIIMQPQYQAKSSLQSLKENRTNDKQMNNISNNELREQASQLSDHLMQLQQQQFQQLELQKSQLNFFDQNKRQSGSTSSSMINNKIQNNHQVNSSFNMQSGSNKYNQTGINGTANSIKILGRESIGNNIKQENQNEGKYQTTSSSNKSQIMTNSSLIEIKKNIQDPKHDFSIGQKMLTEQTAQYYESSIFNPIVNYSQSKRLYSNASFNYIKQQEQSRKSEPVMQIDLKALQQQKGQQQQQQIKGKITQQPVSSGQLSENRNIDNDKSNGVHQYNNGNLMQSKDITNVGQEAEEFVKSVTNIKNYEFQMNNKSMKYVNDKHSSQHSENKSELNFGIPNQLFKTFQQPAQYSNGVLYTTIDQQEDSKDFSIKRFVKNVSLKNIRKPI